MTKQNILVVMKYALVIAMMLVVAVMFSACDIFGGDDKDKDNDSGSTNGGGDSQVMLLDTLCTVIANATKDGYVLAEYDVDEETQAKTLSKLWGYEATTNRFFSEFPNLTTEQIENGDMAKCQLEISSKTMYYSRYNTFYKHILTDEEWEYNIGDTKFGVLGFLNCKTIEQVESYINNRWEFTNAEVNVSSKNNEFTIYAYDKGSKLTKEVIFTFTITNEKLTQGTYIFNDSSSRDNFVKAEFVLNTTFAEHWGDTSSAIEDNKSMLP